ncbi:MAG: tetratricopeptide repeat protein [Actinomycetota bacterium]
MATTHFVRRTGLQNPVRRTPPKLVLIATLLAIAASATVAVRTLGSKSQPVAASVRAVGPLRGIPALTERVRAVPNDANAWAALGSAYVEEARLTGDPRNYPKAEDAIRRSLSITTDGNFGARYAMAVLAAARHDFRTALTWGERARTINPHNAAIHGIIGDALNELGRYPEAFESFQRMLDLRPGIGAYARASYAWELQGNIANAQRALDLALQAASTPKDGAFATFYLGELAWTNGRVAEAERWYRESLAHDPSSTSAIQGLASVAGARGDFAEALRLSEKAVATSLSTHDAAELGDLYAAAGDSVSAQRQGERFRELVALYKANGVDTNLEVALYSADRNVDLADGLAAARAEWSRRQSIHVADALAWSLYANGRYREALAYSKQALHLGTRSALFQFHKGMIERALGMRAAARADLKRAMKINPNFSFLWGPRVVKVLEELA